MPNISSLSAYSFTNWGPLTTTWTAPTHCATETFDVNIARSGNPAIGGWYAQCSIGKYDCMPTGTHSVEATTTLNSIASGNYEAAYFSPGIYCPSGYVTVGVASRDGDKPVNSTGIFSNPSATTTSFVGHNAVFNNPANILMQILEPSETAVLCCPSSMTGNTYIGCYSTLSEYKPTTACMRILPQSDVTEDSATFWYDGVTVTGDILSITGTTPIETSTTTFAASEASELVGVTIGDIITLVHKPSDLSSTGPSSTSNAATRLGSKSTAWDGLSGVLGVSVLGMILGAAIILPF